MSRLLATQAHWTCITGETFGKQSSSRFYNVVEIMANWPFLPEMLFRIEMCGDSDEETFNAVYHEMGHVQYYMAYAKLPPILRVSQMTCGCFKETIKFSQDGPSPVFHEAVGDCMVYAANSKDQLNRLGLSLQDDEELQRLLHLALDRIPLIAWSLVVDRWRWDVFSGKVKEHQYNHHWWKLRRQIQGIVPPIPRDESRFDPLAKFHIADNTPYMP